MSYSTNSQKAPNIESLFGVTVCTHNQPCPVGQRCTVETLRCANWQGDHPSWRHTCPTTEFTIKAQILTEEYATGNYKAYMPFTFSDIEFMVGQCPATLTPPPPIPLHCSSTTHPTSPSPGPNAWIYTRQNTQDKTTKPQTLERHHPFGHHHG